MSTAEIARTLMRDETPRPGRTFADAAADLIGRLDSGKPIVDTLRTGVKLLDETAGGLVRGEFCGLVAAPGFGKSTLADQLVVRMLTMNPGTAAVVLNLETSTPIRLARLICGRAVETNEQHAIVRCVPLGPLLRGELAPDEREHAKAVAAKLTTAVGDRLRFVDDLYDAEGIAALVRSERPDIVLIDHCGLLDVAGTGSLVERFDDALHWVNAAIREVNAAGILISELSKVALTTGAADLGAVRGSARFASLAGQLLTLRRTDDSGSGLSLVAQLHKNRHGRPYVQERLTLVGGLAHVHWSGVVEPIPLARTPGRGAAFDA